MSARPECVTRAAAHQPVEPRLKATIATSSERPRSQQWSQACPETFTICVPVLLGDQRVDVQARFRYRIEEGKLRMWYDLHRPEHAKVAAIQRATQAIRAALPQAPFFLGSSR